MHPCTGSQISVVHSSPSSQLSGVPATHAPEAGSQVSIPLQAFPSLQLVATAVGAPRHAPLTHSSPCVQALPSSQRPVSCVWMRPLIGSHVSVVQGFPSSQLSGVASQAPVAVLQCSIPSQTLPSPALQSAAGDPAEIVPTHLPPTQASTSVHALLSLQAAVLGVCTHASAGRSAVGSHGSSVHTFRSSQLSVVVTHPPVVGSHVFGAHTVPAATQAIAAADGSPLQTRSAQVSGPVHALRSSQATGPGVSGMPSLLRSACSIGGLQPSFGSQAPSTTHTFGTASGLHTSGGTIVTQSGNPIPVAGLHPMIPSPTLLF